MKDILKSAAADWAPPRNARKGAKLACVPDHTSAECEAQKILRALQAAAFKRINAV